MDAEIVIRYNIPKEKLKELSPLQKSKATHLLLKTAAKMIYQDFGVDLHTLSGAAEVVSSTLARIDRGDEDWEGTDLKKIQREAARKKHGG